MFRHALTLALCLLPAMPAHALIVSQQSVAKQLAGATLVAEIAIESNESIADPKVKIRTRSTAEIEHVLSLRDEGRTIPSEGDRITLLSVGGELNGTGMVVPGLPRPRPGHRYRAYLNAIDNDTYTIAGFEQGLVQLDATRDFSRDRTDGSNGAGTGPFLFWDDSYFPIPYYISAPTFAGHPDFVPAIDAAFASWRNVADTRFDFMAMGCSTVTTDQNDGINNVILVGQNWPFDPDSIAITRNFYVSGTTPRSGMILDTDILLNAQYHAFTVTNEPDSYDVQEIVTHEAGHFLGLGHEVDPIDVNATMYAFAFPGETIKRVLKADDIAGIQSIYPGAGRKFQPGTTAASCAIPAATPSCAAVHHRETYPPPEMGWTLAYLVFLMMLGRKMMQGHE